MPPVRMRGDGRMAKDPKKTLLRIFRYMLEYKFTILSVLVCIFTAAYVSSRSATALGKLVDNFILPMVSTGSNDFTPLWNFLVELAVNLLLAPVIVRLIRIGQKT